MSNRYSGEHVEHSLSDCLTQQRRYSVADLLRNLSPCAGKGKVVVKRLKPCSLTQGERTVLERVDALVGSGMHKVDREGDSRFVRIETRVARRESRRDQVLR